MLNMVPKESFNGSTSDQLLQEASSFLRLNIASNHVIAKELPQISKLVEESADDLASRFRSLAFAAQDQSQIVQQVVDMTSVISVNGENVGFAESLEMINKTLQDAVEKILYVSKMAMTMVFSLDEAKSQLSDVDSFIKMVQKITKQTNLLALNATIESARAGEAGHGFAVVANEVKNLSKEISTLSDEMKDKLNSVSSSVNVSYEVLKDVATIDMSDNILIKEKIETLMQSMMQQNENFKQILQVAADSSKQISNNISSAIVGMQFQDKVAQHLDNCKNVIQLMSSQCDELAHNTENLSTETNIAEMQQELIGKILDQFKLGDLKQKFMESMNEHNIKIDAEKYGVANTKNDGSTSNADEDDIELF